MRSWGSLVLPLLSGALLASAKIELQFKEDGSFKITQFADIHYANGELSPCVNVLPEQRPCNDLNTTRFIGDMLDHEQPDLAVFTGDNISGARKAATAIKAYSEPAVSRAIPWAMVFGNHDEEADLNREEMMAETLALPYTVTERGPEEIFGVGNYVLRVRAQNGTNLFNLFFLDSGDYSKKEGVSGYEWVRPSQIQWFLDTSRQIREENGGELVPALMFFHIPIPEYEMVESMVGEKQEGVFAAKVNSGLFAALLETGEVKATFVGHDHVNDYCGKLHGIHLCYGGGVGYGAYGRAGWDRRSRVIEVRDFGASVLTWKRKDNGSLEQIDLQTLHS